jgi:pyruvate formate lyase activating enzyme
MKASFFESFDDGSVKCNLCSHRCLIKEGRLGICGVRANQSGALETLIYGRLVARHIDPIEKKPLFHFYPGSLSFSIAAVGCNFKCAFCQNSHIAKMPAIGNGKIAGDVCHPEDLVQAALDGGCKSISHTYTEPTVNFEFVLETARLAVEKGLKNVFVTNGFITRESMEALSPYLHGANVDLKSFSDDFYKKICGARLSPVKERLLHMKELGLFFEVTTLIIPGLNDDPEELFALASFLARELGEHTPWHISRFHPAFQMTQVRPTPESVLLDVRKIGIKAGLKYIYIGNAPGLGMEQTFCHVCGKKIIERDGFFIDRYLIENGRCHCGAKIPGVGM